MNDVQKEKVKRFLGDTMMSDSVYDVLLTSFMKPKPTADVYLLAASRMAIDLLQDAWKELEKFKVDDGGQGSARTQIGL